MFFPLKMFTKVTLRKGKKGKFKKSGKGNLKFVSATSEVF